MRLSTISKQSRLPERGAVSVAIGRELRRLRIEREFTQAALGSPFSRSFISAVERGHAVPSIPALLLLTERLETSLELFFRGVNSQMTALYTPGHERNEDSSSRSG